MSSFVFLDGPVFNSCLYLDFFSCLYYYYIYIHAASFITVCSRHSLKVLEIGYLLKVACFVIFIQGSSKGMH